MSNSPEAPGAPPHCECENEPAKAEANPLQRTLKTLKGSSRAKALVLFLTRQRDSKATPLDAARNAKARGEPTRIDLRNLQQLVRRTAGNLEARKAPLRLEWTENSIELVNQDGSRPALHIRESADVAK
jgi:hypothetical protein